MTLQLPSLLDISSVKRIGVGMSVACEKPPNLLGDWGGKPGDQ